VGKFRQYPGMLLEDWAEPWNTSGYVMARLRLQSKTL